MSEHSPTPSEQLAWVAGVFEGEGWFAVSNNPGRSPQVAVRMSDRDVIERLREVMGMGSVFPIALQKGHWKQLWQWLITGHSDCQRFAELVGPWLMERRRRRMVEIIYEPVAPPVVISERQLRLVADEAA